MNCEATQMAAWRRLPVPAICERMIGFSVPQDDTVLVVSYEGMHLVHLGSPVIVESDSEYSEYDVYSPGGAGRCCYQGKQWNIIGLHSGCPILTSPDGEHLVLNTNAETVSVVKNGQTVWSLKYDNFSGDWAAATFSPDGRFIVLGCPYDFDFRVFERSLEV